MNSLSTIAATDDNEKGLHVRSISKASSISISSTLSGQSQKEDKILSNDIELTEP